MNIGLTICSDIDFIRGYHGQDIVPSEKLANVLIKASLSLLWRDAGLLPSV